ncbi:GSCOCG00002970001-RA-CDS [Cotesia congregata]|uniref:Similar to Sra1: Steroid receptor RNA activator 1 (Rattus norvegicus) n=1 Tax=Cotesia congregata TaxID=51543 RepID=A0A8J2HK43_COTCN|nr:GSCOCG00002970001-RA-CDS [Cotesia congregata]CAG5093814.1 Similar to Sra1: Steroid receptor RNA activator 1 (Rattus norvegicus) [Cotesia congregata]
MEEKKDEVVSTQKKLQASHDPGWNDPPKWAFTPTPATGSTPTKRLLNKRVAFPLNSSTGPASQSNQVLGSNLPPPMLPSPGPGQVLTSAPHAPLLAPSSITADATSSTVNKQQSLTDSINNFQKIIDSKLENGDKTEEVKRRLDVMKSMWLDDKLNSQIHEKMLELSKALLRNDIETADKIHVFLMTNHTALCNAWISAIRYLILALKDKNFSENANNQPEPILLLNSTEFN